MDLAGAALPEKSCLQLIIPAKFCQSGCCPGGAVVEHLGGEAEHRGLGKTSLSEMREKRVGDGRVGQGDPWVPTTGKYLQLCV